jgi:hypothetical protein
MNSYVNFKCKRKDKNGSSITGNRKEIMWTPIKIERKHSKADNVEKRERERAKMRAKEKERRLQNEKRKKERNGGTGASANVSLLCELPHFSTVFFSVIVRTDNVKDRQSARAQKRLKDVEAIKFWKNFQKVNRIFLQF